MVELSTITFGWVANYLIILTHTHTQKTKTADFRYNFTLSHGLNFQQLFENITLSSINVLKKRTFFFMGISVI